MQVTQRYAILSLLEAALGAVIALAVAILYQISPSSIVDGSLTVTIAGLGALAAAYYLSLHQLLKRTAPMISAIILSVITALNILLVIAATGGLDSPYYALWLLAIVIAGIFGTWSTTTITTITLAFFIYDFIKHRGQNGYIIAHMGQLGISIATAAAAEWIHLALGRDAAHHEEVKALSGQLGQEELKSNVLMQSVGEGVMVVDANRQIQLFNPAATKMTGWDEHSAQNIDYRLVLNLHDAEGNKLGNDADPLSELLRSGKSKIREDLTMQTKGGRAVAISLSLSPIFDNKKKVSGGIALFRDISQEKEIERQRNEFISTASHEMRTPVAAIEGYLALAMNSTVATIDDRAKGYLEKAHASTQHLGELFRDLLSITKLEDNAKPGTEEVFDLTKLIQETAADMEFSAQKKHLELQFSAGDQVRGRTVAPIYAVRGNPQRLREVVMNLIENAIKFTPEGSIRVSIVGNKDTVTVAVIDSGIGIASEDIQHLFQKFYRIDNSATRTIGGTGLGLYLCRSIIERLGGRIWVESKQGEGSSFMFSLPRQASDSIQVEDPAPGTRPKPVPPQSTSAKTAPASKPDPIPVMAAVVPAPKPATAMRKIPVTAK